MVASSIFRTVLMDQADRFWAGELGVPPRVLRTDGFHVVERGNADALAQRLSAAIITVARPDALTLLSDDDLTGKGFNQVAHWKVHLILRYRGDSVAIGWNRGPDPGPHVRAGYAEEIRRLLGAT